MGRTQVETLKSRKPGRPPPGVMRSAGLPVFSMGSPNNYADCLIGSPVTWHYTAPAPPQVTMSNWEARALSLRQVQYGALDALLCGHVFRGLRLWHANPSACPACLVMLGTAPPRQVRPQVIGEPVKRSAELIGEPIKRRA